MQVLLGAMPVETTALLMGLCLPDPAAPAAGGAAPEEKPFVANMADFTHLFVDRWEGIEGERGVEVCKEFIGEEAGRGRLHALGF